MSVLYDRIKLLCSKHNISVSRLESSLGFGNSSISKWDKSSSPSVDKIIKVANFFNVSVDYLIGLSDIETTAADLINDDDIISVQRARQNMSEADKTKMMKLLRVGFDYAFGDDDESEV